MSGLLSAPALAAANARPLPPAKADARAGSAEARLIDIYRLIGQGRAREALPRAEALVRAHPNFQLAQLVLGDLLAAQARPLRALGDAPQAYGTAGAEALAGLREESQLRLRALSERPPAGHVPAPFVKLAPRSRHAIAVDTSRARLYLFKNTPAGLQLLGDYYMSVGKLGVGKQVEGDQRTPLGIYHVTSRLDARKLDDFYGSGALPLNYPNPYDERRGKTGSGIWLHGTPSSQFARAPRASDGCVVLANPDLERILRTVEVRTTPVVIAQRLQWVRPQAQPALEVRTFEQALEAWRQARSSGELARVLPFYMADMRAGTQTLAEWLPGLSRELERQRGKDLALKDLSYLRWTDAADIMVVTFGAVPEGARSGPVRRQYWMRVDSQWKIFYEGALA